MFTIYRYNVGGRIHDYYFKDWDNAKQVLLADLEMNTKSGWKVTGSRDHFDRVKGVYCYDFIGVTEKGTEFSLSLIDGYFFD